MFSAADPTHERLIKIFEKYTALCNRDPAKLAALFIEKKEFWRLFIDGHRQAESWIQFERTEPGYLQALCKAYPLIFSSSELLDINFIKRLHHTALQGVKKTNYTISGSIGDFRANDCPNATYPMTERNMTQRGLEEYLANSDRTEQYVSIAIRVKDKNGLVGFLLEDKLMAAIRQHSAELSGSGNDPFNIIYKAIGGTSELLFLNELTALPEDERNEFISFIVVLSKTKTDKEFVECVMQNLRSHSQLNFYLCSRQPMNTYEILVAKMQSSIANFHINIQHTKNPIEKLRAIIEFIQYCEQLHPFVDGNCRVFCMLLFNHLLIKYGFPIAILHDPNRFDGFSRDELLDEVLKGMENTCELFEKNALYKIRTPDILKLFEERNRKDLLQYFNDSIPTRTPNSPYIG